MTVHEIRVPARAALPCRGTHLIGRIIVGEIGMHIYYQVMLDFLKLEICYISSAILAVTNYAADKMSKLC